MSKVRQIAFLGLMLAIVTVLSWLEHMLPPLPFLPPNVRLGLSNIVTMYCVFFVGNTQAVMLNASKSFFVFLMRGPVAAVFSLCGGMLSIFVIIVITSIFKERASYAAVSVAGAIAHNLGQFAALYIIGISQYFGYYLPVIIVSGIVMGILTGTILKFILPALGNVPNAWSMRKDL